MKYYLLFLVIFSSACAQMFPASARELAPNTYLLTATGNAFASAVSLKAKIDRKAAKICGESHYRYQDAAKLTNGTSTTYANGVATSAGYIQVRRTAICIAR